MVAVIVGILTSFLSSISSSTLKSDCVLSISSEQSQPFSYPGSVVLEGDKFLLSLLDIEAAYDGTTLSVYSDDTEELTLSHPTEEELLQTNPLRFAKALAEVSRVEEKTAANGNQVVTLYPNDLSAGIVRVTLILNREGKMPLSIEVKEVDKLSLLTFTNPALSSNPNPPISFTIEKPDAFLNDLR